jgi:RHS repeat-associated protein
LGRLNLADDPGASVTANNKVWRRFTFSRITTDKIRVYVTGALAGYSRVTEVEAYQVSSTGNNVALAANGSSATASSTVSSGYDPSGVINGDRKGANWGNGGGWNDATLNSYPDWVQVNFNGNKNINEIDVFTLQDNFTNPQEPTEAQTFSLYGIRDFQVQYWDGSAWQTIPGGSVTGNSNVWRKFSFSSITTNKIRVYITGTADGYSRVTEIEAYQIYGYDAAGNVTSDGSHSYTYDAENRVVSVDGSVATYSYDYRNRRVKKAVGSSVTHYVWEAGRVLAEHDGNSGAAIVEYIRLAGAMVAKAQSGSTQYLLSDRQSIRLTLDSGGNVIGRQAHLPFGEDFAESGTQQKHHLTSYERDAESNQDYALNRFHNFSVGRFTSADRVSGRPGNPQSWNRYSYSKNDPINRSDEAGLDEDGLPFDELGLDDILAMLDGGGGGGDDYAFDEFMNVFAGGDDATIEPIPPDESLLEPLLGPHESIDVNAGDDAFIDPFSTNIPGAVGIGIGQPDPGGSDPPPSRQQQAQQLLQDCRTRAMLDAIAWSEGTASDPDQGYGRVYRGTVISAPNNPDLVGQTDVTLTDFSAHPDILVRGGGYTSTAAGRYQFKYSTWQGLGLPDFSPGNQDIGAVMLLMGRRATGPLLAGNLSRATSRAAREWASLPGSPYGQRTRSSAAFNKKYRKALRRCRKSQG